MFFPASNTDEIIKINTEVKEDIGKKYEFQTICVKLTV